MHDTFGTDASDLIAMIGPGISRRSFQVGEEVVGMFRESGFPMMEFGSMTVNRFRVLCVEVITLI